MMLRDVWQQSVLKVPCYSYFIHFVTRQTILAKVFVSPNIIIMIIIMIMTMTTIMIMITIILIIIIITNLLSKPYKDQSMRLFELLRQQYEVSLA